jgi:hypothetical protein
MFEDHFQPVEYWRTAYGKTKHIDFIGANHCLNIVLYLAERHMLDPLDHALFIKKAKSPFVFGPYAWASRWWYDRKRRKQYDKRRKQALAYVQTLTPDWPLDDSDDRG